LALALAVATVTAGCVTTKEEGDALRRDMVALAKDSRAERDRRADRDAEIDARTRELDTRVKALDERALKGQADLGAEITTLRDDVAALRGQLETKEYQLRERELQLGASQQQVKDLESKLLELQKRVEEVDAKVKVAAAAPPPSPVPAPAVAPAPKEPSFPTERQALYDFAKRSLDNGDHELSRVAFERFIKAFPKDKDLLDNAHFWVGEAHLAEKHYDKAILSYQKVVTDFPKSDKVDGALYKMGLAFSGLGYDDDAKVFFEELLQKHPKSALVKDAKARLEELKKKKPAAKKPGKK
jgi:tol-pal system protein YbgF